MNSDNLYAIKKALQTAGRHYRVPWKILMSMAIIETGGGEHFPKGQADELSYNFLGIKWVNTMWRISGNICSTKEQIGEIMTDAKAKFVTYASFEDCAIHACQIIRFDRNYVIARQMIQGLCNGHGQDADGLENIRLILELVGSKWSTNIDYPIICERLWSEEKYRSFLYD